MTTTASLIAEESKKQCSAMPEATGNLTFNQQRFLMMSQNGITLTVWRIVPITRSLIFGITEVRYGKANSIFRQQKCGLSQGAVISCNLLHLYINDLISEIENVQGVLNTWVRR
ncbi:hypothetical protein CDAR_557561 [Caerostris darwini]|uniref:Uncharacterized protein n=1 Tax=Caerostris darwini TaxID=1538125 RepID=A0AAV4RD35_9ARAC|nr:hypothetical protein CDAR_557561 [Caerostris darwini]